jgi:hypothetical protein
MPQKLINILLKFIRNNYQELNIPLIQTLIKTHNTI